MFVLSHRFDWAGKTVIQSRRQLNYEQAQGAVDIWHPVLSSKGRNTRGGNKFQDNMFLPTLSHDYAELKVSKFI